MSTIFKTHEQKTEFKCLSEMALQEENLTMEISRDKNLIVRLYKKNGKLKHLINYNTQTLTTYIRGINYLEVLAEYIHIYHKDDSKYMIKCELDCGKSYTIKHIGFTESIQGNILERKYKCGSTYIRIYEE